MKFLGLFDKLKAIFDLIVNSNTLIILVFLIIAVLLLRLSNKINNKKMGFLIYFVYLLVFGIIFYNQKTILINLGNTLVDNIFLNFYFPSVYVYLFIIAFSVVAFIYTKLNKLISKTYKLITNIYFFTLSFIFVLLINVIATNNIDVFAKESLFTNNDALILLELSTLIFFLYLVINTLVYITNYLILSVESKRLVKVSKKEIVTNNIVLEPIVNNELEVKEELEPKVQVSFNELVNRIENNDLNNIKIDLVPEINTINDKKIDLVPEIKTGFKFLDPMLFEEDDIFNINNLSLNTVKKENKLTINDYKLFSKMLKTVIENNQSVNLGLSDILNKNLLSKYSLEEYNKFEEILNSCLN